MKKIFFLIAFALCNTVYLIAQQTTESPKKPKFELNSETMTTIGITAEIQSEISEMKKKLETEVKTIRKDASVGEEEKKLKIKSLRDNFEKSLQALLTPEQKKKLREMRQEANKP